MSARFAAYSFVDRITALDTAGRAQARFLVDYRLPAFPDCLLVEAVGQLAAWVAMQRTEFMLRPVAALATEVRFTQSAQRGDDVELEVNIDSCDDSAVVYSGRASAQGRMLVQLRRCLGPMQPVEDFDSPDHLRRDFEQLVGDGAPPRRFQGIEPLRLGALAQSDAGLRADLEVPTDAAFFADHFPRKPVLPATLLLDVLVRLALDATAGLYDSNPLRVERAVDIKLRRYVLPGQTLQLSAQVTAAAPFATVAVCAQRGAERIATARIECAPERVPCNAGV